MFKSPTEYAKLMLETHLGDFEEALTGLYEAAKAHPNLPNKFWRDVAKEIEGSNGPYFLDPPTEEEMIKVMNQKD